ncbi:HD-GYP domain-containing protein [Streptomyces sp. TR06-5]|uniref:HD-GYP domain-containing protein n=1 Tax=unclassified Streptomyces TaxID=2593676 RepID=UPI00399FF063
MGARGTGLPASAGALVGLAALAAAGCTLPSLLRPAGVPWATVLVLAALYTLAEALPRCRLVARLRPGAEPRRGAEDEAPPEVCGTLLLAAVLLLPPGAAALVPLAGAAVGRVPARHPGARRLWRVVRPALAAYAGALAPALLLPGPPGNGPVAAAGLPGALLPAALSVLTHCLVLTALDGAILVAAERCAPRAAWRGRFLPVTTVHLVQAPAALLMALLWRSTLGPAAALPVLLPMALCCWTFAAYQRERTAHHATVRALVQAVDIKDRYTRGHGERVGRASAMIARELGMDGARTETLRFAGILHDVGKLGVPTRLLRKAGPLSPLERSVLELHPEYGHEMVRGIRFLGEARSAILHHHERLDGTGYPYGLAGEQIPEPARLVAVADAFDAMTSHRSYSRARPVPDALTELERCAGTHFDPRMVSALVRALERHGWSPAATADPPGDDASPQPVPAVPRTGGRPHDAGRTASRRHGVPPPRTGRRTAGGRHRAAVRTRSEPATPPEGVPAPRPPDPGRPDVRGNHGSTQRGPG